MNSPFGLHGQLAKEFGFSMHEILWKIPRVQLLLMLADRPSTRKQKVKKGTPELLNELF
jgi:hypothetical protein